MPTDLDVLLTFNDAAKLAQLNADKALGHDDWQIPDLEQLKLLYRNQEVGELRETFSTVAASGSSYPFWYWSSTEDPDYPSVVYCVRFSDGLQGWDHKDFLRLACRPVRLVAAARAPPQR
jgi:hypothetical protein